MIKETYRTNFKSYASSNTNAFMSHKKVDKIYEKSPIFFFGVTRSVLCC